MPTPFSAAFGQGPCRATAHGPPRTSMSSSAGLPAGRHRETQVDHYVGSRLANRLSLGPFIVVPYSTRGAIAPLLCRRHPDEVRGLVAGSAGPARDVTSLPLVQGELHHDHVVERVHPEEMSWLSS